MRLHHILPFASGLTLGVFAPPHLLPESPAAPPPAPASSSVEAMLGDFVDDYRRDATAAPLTFGIEVRDAVPSRWHVIVGARDAGDGLAPVSLHAGFPSAPCAYFTTDTATLGRIHAGTLASLTAMGKAFDTDAAPLDLDVTEGFQPGAAQMEQLVKLAFHFWTRGFPEVVRFGDLDAARTIHGGEAVLFYYQPGFRSGWFHIRPGQHVNEHEASKTNPFPTLLIITEGTAQARIGDTEATVRGGETLYIGPGVRHEFWVGEDAEGGASGIIVMFGEGA